MNTFGDLFRNRRARSRTFSGRAKAKAEPQNRAVRSSSDTSYEVYDVSNPEENKTLPYDSEPTTKKQAENGEGSKPSISALERNLRAVDPASIQSNHGEKTQTSNGLSQRQTGVSYPEEPLCAVGFPAGRGKLRKKSLSTSNIFLASTQQAYYPVEFNLDVSAVFDRKGMQTLYTKPERTEVEASLEKTSSRRRILLVKETESHAAIACDNDRQVCCLLDERNLDPNETCKNALTLLHRAAIEGSYRCLKVLLSHGADVNARDLDGWTPLHDAVFHGHAHCALALLLSGADVEAETLEFVKPIEMAEDDDMVLLIGRAMTMYQEGVLSKPDRETLV